MNEKSWLVLRIVAGLYVIYLGYQIVSGMLTERPENMVFMMTAGILFIVIGAVIVIISAKSVIAMRNKLQNEEETSSEEDNSADTIEADPEKETSSKEEDTEEESEEEMPYEEKDADSRETDFSDDRKANPNDDSEKNNRTKTAEAMKDDAAQDTVTPADTLIDLNGDTTEESMEETDDEEK